MKSKTKPKSSPGPSPTSTQTPSGWQQLRAHYLVLALLLLGIVALFSYTVAIRAPWFGTLSTSPFDGHHQWLTGSTVKFIKNWYREGAWHLGFLMLQNPRSVEFPTLESRVIYPSYPPGTLLPLFGICKLIHQEATPPLVEGFNLANHLLIACGLALIVYLLLARLALPPVHAGLFALIPPLIVLLLPAPIYFFQNVFFSDQAIVLPFVLMILGEVLREYPLSDRQRRGLDIAQGVLLWYGFFTDWLFVFIGIVLYAKRLLRGEIPTRGREFFTRSLALWLGPAIALALFALQLTVYHQWSVLFGTFLLRTASTTEALQDMAKVHFFQRFWTGFVSVGYGGLAVWLLWGSLLGVCAALLALWRKRREPEPNRPVLVALLSLMSITLLPCFIEIYTLKHHSYVHDFAALKFLVPLSIVPFVLLPVYWLAWRRRIPLRVAPAMTGVSFSPALLAVNLVLLLCVSVYTLSLHPQYRNFFPTPLPVTADQLKYFAQFDYHDILVSRQHEIPFNPPQMLSYTMKRVYKITTPKDLEPITAGIREPYQVVEVPF